MVRDWEVRGPVEDVLESKIWIEGLDNEVRKGVIDKKGLRVREVVSLAYTLQDELFSLFLVICDDALHNPLDPLSGNPDMGNCTSPIT